jgi:scyllo-inositol 2-dehydrogenase (NADP+)
VGLVGYGLAGEVLHGGLVRACPGMVVVAAVTRSAERAERLDTTHPGARAVPDLDALLGDMHPDLVVVASPDGQHAVQARAALDAGAAVVVDKPLATSSAAAEELVSHARSLGRMLTAFHNRRWDSDQLTLARLVEDGTLGRVYRHETRFERWRPDLDPAKWRDRNPTEQGGGTLLDLGTHLVDQSVQLFGPVARVHAEIAARRGGSDDEAFLALTHTGGAVSHVSVGSVFGAPGPRRRVLAERGAYVVDVLDSQEDQLRSGVAADDPGFGVEPEERWGRLHRGDDVARVPSEAGRWRDFYPAVLSALVDGTPPPVDPADAEEVLRVLEAARRSSDSGSTVEP